MTWVWRRVFRFGPIRTTLSSLGVGWSFGIPFLRYGVGPSGVRYVSVGVPGTGLYFTKFLGRGTSPSPPYTVPLSPRQNHSPTASPPPTILSANQRIVEAYKNRSNP